MCKNPIPIACPNNFDPTAYHHAPSFQDILGAAVSEAGIRRILRYSLRLDLVLPFMLLALLYLLHRPIRPLPLLILPHKALPMLVLRTLFPLPAPGLLYLLLPRPLLT